MGAPRAPGGDDLMECYLTEIGRHPLLDRREEARLARRARVRGDGAARRKLVASNLRFVVALAKRYRGRGVPFADLVNEGNVGLVMAAEKFDERHGVRFVTYAAWWVRRAMLAALTDSSPPVAAGRRGSGSGGAREADVPSVQFVSLDDPGRRGPLGERLADRRGAAPDRDVHRGALRDTLEAGLAFLPAREERVLRGYFGLDGRASRSLRCVGRELGVSGERARQLKDRALDRLRAGPHAAALEAFTR